MTFEGICSVAPQRRTVCAIIPPKKGRDGSPQDEKCWGKASMMLEIVCFAQVAHTVRRYD